MSAGLAQSLWGRACGIKVLGGIAIRILSRHRILSDFSFFLTFCFTFGFAIL